MLIGDRAETSHAAAGRLGPAEQSRAAMEVSVLLPHDPRLGDVICSAVESQMGKAAIRRYNRALPFLRELGCRRADWAVVDTNADDSDGLDYIPEILERKLADKLVVVASRFDCRLLAFLKKCGAHAILDGSSADANDVRRAVLAIDSGRRYVSPSLEPRMQEAVVVHRSRTLTEQEEFMLSLFGAGYDEATLADCLGMKPHCVHSQRKRIGDSLGIARNAALGPYAIAYGYLRITEVGALLLGHQRRLREILERTRMSLPTQSCVTPVLSEDHVEVKAYVWPRKMTFREEMRQTWFSAVQKTVVRRVNRKPISCAAR